MPARKTAEFRSWSMMRDRCNNPNAERYADYGGRGIKVCERWGLFRNFLADMGLKPSPAHSLERKENDGDYTPENCRWATPTEQANNRRSNQLLTFGGKTLTRAQWAKETGISQQTLYHRLKAGATIEQALTTPVGANRVWSGARKPRSDKKERPQNV